MGLIEQFVAGMELEDFKKISKRLMQSLRGSKILVRRQRTFLKM